MTRTGAAARPQPIENRSDTFLDWFQTHSRWIIIGAVVILAAAVGLWLYVRTQEIRTERAAESLLQVQTALAQGNVPLARTDLERLVTRYEGTPASVQGAFLLAQIHYEAGDYQRGIQVLREAENWRTARPQAAALAALIADGLSELGQPAEAAEQYRRAAELSTLSVDRAAHLGSAARALTAAGNTQGAAAIWRELAEDPESPGAAEARVRLGELEAQPASR